MEKKKNIQFVTIGFFGMILAAMLTLACTSTEEKLRQRAAELCEYIPGHGLKEQSKDFMTPEFYAVLDTLFNLPEHEAMDHEWLHYFTTGNGGTTSDYEVVGVELTDDTHAIATINVRQKREDGSFDESSDVEQHLLFMEQLGGKWLMADFDEHLQDCINQINTNRREQALRDAISRYLVEEVGVHYLQGELCVPSLMIAAEEGFDSVETRIYGDFWVFWYNQVGDTLKTVSGGSHPGRMTLLTQDGTPKVSAFDQAADGSAFTPSAKRIFGEHYDLFSQMYSNADVREAVRQEQLSDYVSQHNINAHFYQDYGWAPKELTLE